MVALFEGSIDIRALLNPSEGGSMPSVKPGIIPHGFHHSQANLAVSLKQGFGIRRYEIINKKVDEERLAFVSVPKANLTAMNRRVKYFRNMISIVALSHLSQSL